MMTVPLAELATLRPPLTPPVMGATEPPVVSPFVTAPPHTHTESTLAPTSEFMRYVLAALPSRYVLRGGFGLGFNDRDKRKDYKGFAYKVLNFLGAPGDALAKRYGMPHGHAESAAYSGALGLGSLWLTLSYSATVYKDIKNIFSEAVGAEFGKPADQVNFNDIRRSENHIVQKTLENFGFRMLKRLAVDALFIPAAMLRHDGAGDFVLGLKGAQLFAETWKRKTTMFEDLVTFVNNKINPRNGLGQPIGVGEIFDLYQHYAQEFHPDQAFSNVIEHTSGESVLWARSEPIFQRITALMNQTYAYKHPTMLNPQTGTAVRQANFPLPTLIHLLGHDLIDLRNPERTQITIEVANQYGIAGVQQMRALFAQGASNEAVMARYGVTIPPPTPASATAKAAEKNGVIAKGSTIQLDHPAAASPSPLIDASSVLHAPPTASLQLG